MYSAVVVKSTPVSSLVFLYPELSRVFNFINNANFIQALWSVPFCFRYSLMLRPDKRILSKTSQNCSFQPFVRCLCDVILQATLTAFSSVSRKTRKDAYQYHHSGRHRAHPVIRVAEPDSPFLKTRAYLELPLISDVEDKYAKHILLTALQSQEPVSIDLLEKQRSMKCGKRTHHASLSFLFT